MSIFDPIEEGDAPFSGEPSAYDLHVARARQERELRQQIRRHGDESMRVEPKMEDQRGIAPIGATAQRRLAPPPSADWRRLWRFPL